MVNMAPQNFWDSYSYLINKRDEFSDDAFNSTSDLLNHLQSIALYFELDAATFLQEFESQQVKDIISYNIQTAAMLQVYQIPTLLINNVKQPLDVNITYASLLGLIKSPVMLPPSLDPPVPDCAIYYGFMIIFLIIIFILLVIVILMCVNNRVKSIEKKFDPGKMWETVTVGNISPTASPIIPPAANENPPEPSPKSEINHDEVEVEMEGHSQHESDHNEDHN